MMQLMIARRNSVSHIHLDPTNAVFVLLESDSSSNSANSLIFVNVTSLAETGR